MGGPKAEPKLIDQIAQTEKQKEVQVKQNVIICEKCNHKIPVQNEMQIDKKGVKLKCLPCSFKSVGKSKTTSDSTKKMARKKFYLALKSVRTHGIQQRYHSW